MDDEETRNLIQKHTNSKVTVNFFKILKKLATNNKSDVSKFIKGCNAIGNFVGQNEFLTELFNTWNGTVVKSDAESTSSSQSASPIESMRRPVAVLQEKRSIVLKTPLALNQNDDEEDEEDNLHLPLINTASPIIKKKLAFKKITKASARIKNEYSEATDELKTLSKDNTTLSWKIKPSSRVKLEELLVNSSESEVEIEENDEEYYSDEELVTEDRDWYDQDEGDINTASYDHIFKPKISKLQSSKFISSSDDEHLSIKLNITPLNKRAETLPGFLKSYAADSNIDINTIVGSLLTGNSANDGIVSPFRNPDGNFSVAARKGSYLVAKHRQLKERIKIHKDATDLVGTTIGDIMGLQSNSDKNKTNDNVSKVSGAPVSEKTPDEIKNSNENLPIYGSKISLLNLIRENQVSVIIGETGSGKTTQLPQYLYEAGYAKDGMLIACTQPRRVAAMSVAKRVAEELDVQLGQEVGYSIRFEDVTSENTKIRFMSEGILLRECLSDKSLSKYSCVIIDEAHERSLNTDVLMGLFKQLLALRNDIRIIITSATINADTFSKFFGGAPQLVIPGRIYPVEIVYSKHLVSDYVEAAVSQAVRTHMSTSIDSGDILIFMTGQEDIEVTSEVIKTRLLEVYTKKFGITLWEDVKDISILPIYSSLPADLQSKIFQDLGSSVRKIVISTNIAETSLTINGIRYVIDCGYNKVKVYNPKIGLDNLLVVPIACSNADQRSGRAGRTAPGTAYRLYPEEVKDDELYSQPIPEIQRSNLSNVTLLLKSLKVDNILNFPFLDSPPKLSFLTSLYELWLIEAIDNKGNLTDLGVEMAKFPLLPSLAKTLIISSKFGCSEEMLLIVSMLSIPQVFYRPKERQEESDLARSRFFIDNSDHLTLLNVYSQWKAHKYSKSWCAQHYLQYKSLVRAREIKRQLSNLMKAYKIPIISSGTKWDIIRKCICSGFSHQTAKLEGLGKYTQLKSGMSVKLHPTSALFGRSNLPQYVIYNELLMIDNEYICCVSGVDPFWLMEYGSLLYDVRRVKDIDNGQLSLGDNLNQNVKLEKDEIDIKIEEVMQNKKKLIEKIEYDGKTIDDDIQKKQVSKRQGGKGSVRIGFKKRRPF